MIIVCSSQTPKDVSNGLVAAKERKTIPTGILQIGRTLYYQLKRKEKGVQECFNKRPKNYKINLNTRVLHKKGCKSAKGRLVDAAIINVAATGLRKCKRCMK